MERAEGCRSYLFSAADYALQIWFLTSLTCAPAPPSPHHFLPLIRISDASLVSEEMKRRAIRWVVSRARWQQLQGVTRQTLRSRGSKTGLSLLSYFFFFNFYFRQRDGKRDLVGEGGVEERLVVIKEEFGGRKRAGCERGVAAAKERNAIKAHSLRLCCFFFRRRLRAKSRGRQRRTRCVYSTENKKHKGTL